MDKCHLVFIKSEHISGHHWEKEFSPGLVWRPTPRDALTDACNFAILQFNRRMTLRGCNRCNFCNFFAILAIVAMGCNFQFAIVAILQSQLQFNR